jgi:hypothetical protein
LAAGPQNPNSGNCSSRDLEWEMRAIDVDASAVLAVARFDGLSTFFLWKTNAKKIISKFS